jgi:hypothetical protein
MGRVGDDGILDQLITQMAMHGGGHDVFDQETLICNLEGVVEVAQVGCIHARLVSSLAVGPVVVEYLLAGVLSNYHVDLFPTGTPLSLQTSRVCLIYRPGVIRLLRLVRLPHSIIQTLGS